jgi:hypothetical protein
MIARATPITLFEFTCDSEQWPVSADAFAIADTRRDSERERWLRLAQRLAAVESRRVN